MTYTPSVPRFQPHAHFEYKESLICQAKSFLPHEYRIYMAVLNLLATTARIIFAGRLRYGKSKSQLLVGSVVGKMLHGQTWKLCRLLKFDGSSRFILRGGEVTVRPGRAQSWQVNCQLSAIPARA